ncbi:MAG TPA: hypothetical protein VGE45_02285 [Chloroflexia bacterium]|jgi:hypothetical protein
MDAFSEVGIAVLENHRYLLAGAAVKRWVPNIMARPGASLAISNLERMALSHAGTGMAGSDKRVWLRHKR